MRDRLLGDERGRGRLTSAHRHALSVVGIALPDQWFTAAGLTQPGEGAEVRTLRAHFLCRARVPRAHDAFCVATQFARRCLALRDTWGQMKACHEAGSHPSSGRKYLGGIGACADGAAPPIRTKCQKKCAAGAQFGRGRDCRSRVGKEVDAVTRPETRTFSAQQGHVRVARTCPIPLGKEDQFSARSVMSWVQAPEGSLVIAGFSSETAERSVFTVCP